MLDPYFDAWWVYVGAGFVALAFGALVWAFGCLRLFLSGYRAAGVVLWVAGALMVSGNVLGAVFFDLVLPYRTAGANTLIPGFALGAPDLLLLPDDAVTWAVTGLALVVLGVGLLAIRTPPRTDGADEIP